LSPHCKWAAIVQFAPASLTGGGPSTTPFADLLAVLHGGSSGACSSRPRSGRWTGSDGCRSSYHDGLAIARDAEGRIGRTCSQNLQAARRVPNPSRASRDDGALRFPQRTAISPGPDWSLGHSWSGSNKASPPSARPFYFTRRIAGQTNMPDDAGELGFQGGELSSAAQPSRGDHTVGPSPLSILPLKTAALKGRPRSSAYEAPRTWPPVFRRAALSPSGLPAPAARLLSSALGEKFGLSPEWRPALVAHSRGLLELLTF
jgi:hypothetical protein